MKLCIKCGHGKLIIRSDWFGCIGEFSDHKWSVQITQPQLHRPESRLLYPRLLIFDLPKLLGSIMFNNDFTALSQLIKKVVAMWLILNYASSSGRSVLNILSLGQTNQYVNWPDHEENDRLSYRQSFDSPNCAPVVQNK